MSGLAFKMLREEGKDSVLMIQVKPDIRRVLNSDGYIHIGSTVETPPVTDSVVISIEKEFAPEFFRAMSELYHSIYEGK